MTSKKFNSLAKNIKKDILLRSGSFLAERRWGVCSVLLYQLDQFYVEVFFVKWTKTPIGFRTFHSTNKLEPYLQQIDVRSLMQEVLY
jgi:hypothetical protein